MENNKKQTAVEWLADQLECFGNKHELQMSWTTLDELLEQAKEMEKKEKIDFACQVAEASAEKYIEGKTTWQIAEELLTFKSE
jgi:glucose-6-phosphate 1-dehydrogenase